MRYAAVISAGFWFFVGLVVTLWSTRYRLGTITAPGPGLYPLGLGLLLILLSLVLFAQTVKTGIGRADGQGFSARGGLKGVAYLIGVLLVSIFLFEWAGYLLTIFLLMMLLTVQAGGLGWKRGLLIAALAVAGVYVVFVLLLEQQLPRGLLWG